MIELHPLWFVGIVCIAHLSGVGLSRFRAWYDTSRAENHARKANSERHHFLLRWNATSARLSTLRRMAADALESTDGARGPYRSDPGKLVKALESIWERATDPLSDLLTLCGTCLHHEDEHGCPARSGKEHCTNYEVDPNQSLPVSAMTTAGEAVEALTVDPSKTRIISVDAKTGTVRLEYSTVPRNPCRRCGSKQPASVCQDNCSDYEEAFEYHKCHGKLPPPTPQLFVRD